MNKSVFLAFIFGVGVGMVVMDRVCQTKYERLNNKENEEDIRNMEAVYEKRIKKLQKDLDEARNVSEYVKKVNDFGYNNEVETEKGGNLMLQGHRVIDPEEFGISESGDDFDCVSLVYYADGVLTDTWDQIIQNVEDLVGEEFPEHFGEYEDDIVFVRNYKLCTDYEICRDNRKFTEVNGDMNGDT